MITSRTIKCDWRGCTATIVVPTQFNSLSDHGWKEENYSSIFSLHLCPDHRRKNWLKVREQIERIADGSHLLT